MSVATWSPLTSLTHLHTQGSTNKAFFFVCLMYSQAKKKKISCGLKLCVVNFSSLCKSALQQLFSQATVIAELIICSSVLFISLMHVLHQLCLNTRKLTQKRSNVVPNTTRTHKQAQSCFHHRSPVLRTGGGLSKRSVLSNSPSRWQCRCHSSGSRFS